MKRFGRDGQVEDAPEGIPFNDLTVAPVYDELPEITLYVPIVVPAADGRPRLALVEPSVLATSRSVGAVAERVSGIEPVIEGMPAVASRVKALEDKPEPEMPDVPQASAMVPGAVDIEGQRGESAQYARADHTHAARVQRRIVTLAANGTSTWTFTRPFKAEPSLQYMVFQQSGAPIVVEAAEWVRAESEYTGVVVKAYRSQALPQLATVTGILTAVITGVNGIVSALTGFNVFGGGNLSGVKVHLSAGDQM